MARVRAILSALALLEKRERRRFGSIATNNFFLATVLLLQQAGVFLYLLGALVVLFPMSADPLRKVPAERLSQWPLTTADRRWLRVISPWLNPILLLLVVLAAWSLKHVESASLLGVTAALFCIGFFAPTVSGQPGFLRWIPAFPGRIGFFVQRGIRETMVTLDFWVAALISASGAAYRISMPELPGEARMMMTILVVLALSSRAQCLLGLDPEAVMTRHKLMPVPGWQILAAEDAAFVLITVLLTLPLAPVAGLASALAALAVGHRAAVMDRRPQTRWRFSGGANLGDGVVQVLALASAASVTFRNGPLVLVPCVLACAGSAVWFGRLLDRR